MNKVSGQNKNRILAALPNAELARLAAHLSPVELPQGKILLDGDLRYGYFMEEGVASIMVTLHEGETVGVGVVGFDGLVGLPILLGTESVPGRTLMQSAGSGFRIEANVLRAAYETPSELRSSLQRYMQGYLVQSAQTCACNRLHSIEERLARWLLCCRDRTDSDELSLTHERLAQMLGAPRTTVTLAAGLLQCVGAIQYSRGVISIRSCATLKKSACECYRVIREQFERLGLF